MFKGNIDTIKEGVRTSISNNGIALIENALLPEVADTLYKELSESTAWEHEEIIGEGGTDKEFRYARDRILIDSNDAPPSLSALKEFVRGEECRNFITYISGLTCMWFDGSAARLLPGNEIGVHNDNADLMRTIGFNLYLSKHWQPEYGGEFVLLNPHVVVAPVFNRLSLFRVTSSSHHKVNQVSEKAKEGRLAISGWFSWGKPHSKT